MYPNVCHKQSKLTSMTNFQYFPLSPKRLWFVLYCHASEILNAYGIPLTENDRKLSSFRGIHRGRKCFIIGNGPSLQIDDLDRIQQNKYISIASNKIYLAHNETNWRPSYYTVGDRLVAENNTKQIRELDLFKFFPTFLKSIMSNSKSPSDRGRNFYFRALHGKYDANGKYLSSFSPNIIKGFHIGQTVTNLNIQLAYYLGCNPIILIGLDGVYKGSTTLTSHDEYGRVYVSHGEINHFNKDYRKIGERWSIPNIEYHEIAFNCCKKFLEKRGVTILNASRRSAVKAFARINLDSILRS